MKVIGTSGLAVILLLSASPKGLESAGSPDVAVQTEAVARTIDGFALKDALGANHSLDDWKDRRAVVVVFLGTECPLVKLYSPRLVELAKAYRTKGVQFVGIDSNQQDSLAAIAHFARQHKIDFPILKDPGNLVADRFGAERTPEAFVLDSKHVVRYRGRIDDQFGAGYARTSAASRHLAEALDDVLAGRPVRAPKIEAVGCRIGRVNRRAPQGSVTYCNQISRIIQAHCVSCHRAGEIAPFALTSYKDAASWAETIREVVDNRRMPPWYANPQYGEFSNDARLTDDEKRNLAAWIENGLPEGDPSQLPAPPKFAQGWQISKPDLIVKMPKAFTVPASGVVEYQHFFTSERFDHDVWIKAAEGRPGNRGVVHHMVLFWMPAAEKKFRPQDPLFNTVASAGPGVPALVAPEGCAWRIPAGSKLVFQMHYTPNGSEQIDQSMAGFVFADPKTVKRELLIGAVTNWQFEIPPGAADHRVEARQTFEEDTLLYALVPHMHLRGKAFRYVAEYPDKRTEILLDVPRYDFNWQNIYHFSRPKLMPRGSVLHGIARYDNSEQNLANPDPTQAATYGEQTWNEMMVGLFYYAKTGQQLSLRAPGLTRR